MERNVMNRNLFTKKWYENHYLDYFLNTDCGKSVLKELQITTIQPDEAPDFIAHTQDRKRIGIEIVNFHIGKNCEFYLTIDTIFQNVFLKAQQTLRNKYFMAIYFPKPIYFKTTKIHKEELGDLLYKKVEMLDKQYPENGKDTGKWETINVGGSNEILYRYEHNEKYFGGVAGGGGLVIQNPDIELIECVAKKDKKYCSYLKKCDKCALLIVSDFYKTKSEPFEFTDADNIQVRTKFDKVFLLELGGQPAIKATQLKIQN